VHSDYLFLGTVYKCSFLLTYLYGVDLSGLNAMKCFFVHTLNVDDLDHPTITSLLRNPAYCDIKLQFSRSSDDDQMLGLVHLLLDAWFVQTCPVAVWHSSNALVSINEVSLRCVGLVLRWVTMSSFNFWCRTFISVCDQPPRPTQPSFPQG